MNLKMKGEKLNQQELLDIVRTVIKKVCKNTTFPSSEVFKFADLVFNQMPLFVKMPVN